MGYYRWPRTTSERRASESLRVDGREHGIRPRTARTGHYLPNGWDDLHCSTCGHRCWKRFRRTQWKTA